MSKLYRIKPLVWRHLEGNSSSGAVSTLTGSNYVVWCMDGARWVVLMNGQDHRAPSPAEFGTIEAAMKRAENLHLKDLLMQLEEATPEAPRWISVAERMPEEDANGESDTYLCFKSLCGKCDNGRTFLAHTRRGVWWDESGPIESNTEVTHYMELPQPPRGGA